MRKTSPYVNLEIVKDNEGNVERFIIHTVSYLPEDSKISTSGEGKVADNVLYRQLSITYNGTSNKYDYFGVDFNVDRKDVGLLERGVRVLVKAEATSLKTADTMAMASEAEEGDEGTVVEYDDPIV